MKIKAFFLLFLVFAFFVIPNLRAEAEWTVLVYMAADNNLSRAAFDDVNELESVEYNDSVNVIVQIDPNDNLSYPPYFSAARRYYIRYDENPDSIGSDLLTNLGEINSADPYELSSFANWGFDKYKSKKKILVIWDHGNGWRRDNSYSVKSLCYDNSFNDRMSVARGELAQGLENINEKIDILIFDACLMQMVEVIGEIYEECDIIMGCEMDVPSDGIFYGDYKWSLGSRYGMMNYLTEFPEVTGKTFAEELVGRYVGSYVSGVQTGDNTSMSAIDCKKYADSFLPALSSFSLTFADTTYFNLLHSVYDDCYSINSDKYLDCRQFFNNLSHWGNDNISIMAEEVKSSIDSMVIRYLAYVDNSINNEIGRFSINLPRYVNNFSDWELYGNLTFVKDTRWDRFIAFFHKDYPNSNDSPIIEKFSINSKGEYVQATWEALAPTLINFDLLINFSLNISKEREEPRLIHRNYSSKYYDTTLSEGYYNFWLIARDEFSNTQDTTKFIKIKGENYFSFYPNPFSKGKYDKGYFLCSDDEWENPSIKIYNQAGEIVEKITLNSAENPVKKIEYKAGKLASGIYFCVLTGGDRVRKITLAVIR